MKRREVLTLAGAAALGGSGCATLLMPPEAPFSSAAMDGFLSRLDRAMETVGQGMALKKLVPGRSRAEIEASPDWGRNGELIRKTFRSLLLVGSMHDLPPEGQAHPGMQQRLRASMGEFDDAMLGAMEALDSLPATQRADVATALREDPGIGMRVMGAIDEEAEVHGVSKERRRHLRALSAHACSRLKQSPDLCIAEYVHKARRVAAWHGASAEAQREVAARLSAQVVMGDEPGGGSHVAWDGGPKEGTTTPGPCPPAFLEGWNRCADDKPAPAAPPKRRSRVDIPDEPHPGTGALRAGGVILGLGVVSVGVGGLISLASPGMGMGLAVGLTVGAILGVIAVVVLLIGLIIYLAN